MIYIFNVYHCNNTHFCVLQLIPHYAGQLFANKVSSLDLEYNSQMAVHAVTYLIRKTFLEVL